MQTRRYTVMSFDNLNLFAYEWKPDKGMKGAVVFIHGLGEHSGRYAHVGDMLTKNGYGLFGFDLRGHGTSSGARGFTPSRDAFNKDIDAMLESVKTNQPGIPIFLYGHSFGANLVLDYVLQRAPKLKGVIATAPGLHTALVEQKGKVMLAKIVGSISPMGIMASGLNPNDISRDPEVVRKYREDPLVHDRVSFGMAKSSLQTIQWVLEHAHEFSLPLLLMHGSEDKISYASGSREFASRVKVDCTLKIWEGLSHELHNEPEKEAVFAYIIEWLEKH